jgi:hypothetical protein
MYQVGKKKKKLAAYQEIHREVLWYPRFLQTIEQAVKTMRDHEIGSWTMHKWMREYTAIGHRSTDYSVLCQAWYYSNKWTYRMKQCKATVKDLLNQIQRILDINKFCVAPVDSFLQIQDGSHHIPKLSKANNANGCPMVLSKNSKPEWIAVLVFHL